jgi:aminoglycoside phosphotransferase family enzyme
MSTVELTPVAAAIERWLPAFESVDAPIEIVETPLSWVLLTERHAYKVKKSIDVGDARFRSPDQRRQACTDEVWLNRRLARGIYLGVVPITRGAGGEVVLGGKGPAVEWAVKMRRLNPRRNMLNLLSEGALSDEYVQILADVLANFYFVSPPVTISLEELQARLQRRIDAGKLLEARQPASLRRELNDLRAAQTDFLHRTQIVLNLRVCDGRVIDGHGDLRLEHVFFERTPAIIDCVEYNVERRQCDALDDLAALTMECHRHGRDDVAAPVMIAYRARTDDDCFPHLEAFYRSLHATTRANELLAADECDAGASAKPRRAEVASYLEQACRDANVFA